MQQKVKVNVIVIVFIFCTSSTIEIVVSLKSVCLKEALQTALQGKKSTGLDLEVFKAFTLFQYL